MNLEHFRAFLWLRWRLRFNQVKRSGTLATVLVTIVLVMAAVSAVGLLVGSFLIGLFAFRDSPAAARLYTWDGITVAFIFGWSIGLLTELQRTESLALDKFLHLPVSLSGAFLINYLASLVSLSLLLLVPTATGLILGQVFSTSPAMLLAIPLFVSFVFAVTSLTYLFQGWLASLMANPRRRRTVIVLVTLGFIVFFQLPNLINMARPWQDRQPTPVGQTSDEEKALEKEFLEKKMTNKEYTKRKEELRKVKQDRQVEESRQKWERTEATVRLMNAVIPPGWFPLGAADLAEGNVLPALLGTLGFTLIGSASLWRAYRSTVRLYTGATRTGETARPQAVQRAPSTRSDGKPRLIEWHLPGIPEAVAAVALASFRSMLRAPETKMMLLTPIIFVFIFGSVVLSGELKPPTTARPLIAFGGGLMILLTGIQLSGNQFGYDRAGFRAYVLSPIPRRDILFGKNLAIAPITLSLTLLAVVAVEIFYPMRIDHLLATFVQLLTVFLLFCLMANLLSIWAPIPIAAGSFKPSSTRLTPVLLHMLFLAIFPVVLAPTLLPLGIEVLLAELAGIRDWPIALGLSIGLFMGVWVLYRRALNWEGELLTAREQTILEVVTSKSE